MGHLESRGTETLRNDLVWGGELGNGSGRADWVKILTYAVWELGWLWSCSMNSRGMFMNTIRYLGLY